MKATYLWQSLVDSVVPITHAPNQPASYVRHVLPDSSPNLVCLWERGLEIYDKAERVALPNLSISGQLTHRKAYHCSIDCQGLIIKLKPWAVGLLMDWEAAELTDRTLPLHNHLQRMDRIGSPPMATGNEYESWLESILANCFSAKVPDDAIVQAIQAIETAQRGTRIKDLAGYAATCTRQFERRFKIATGLSPKQFVRNVRFQRARSLLTQGCSLLDVTYGCGYFDQTHFTREFKRISGVTPRLFQQDTKSLFY